MTDTRFFEILDDLFSKVNVLAFLNDETDLYKDFMKKYEDIKSNSVKAPVEVTEKGIQILQFMKENEGAFNNTFSAANIANGIGISPKSVSGSMGKLVRGEYCSKTKGNPTCYHLNDKGREFAFL